MSTRIGIVWNCQTHGLANSLRALLPSADIIGYALPSLAGKPDEQQAAADELATCDVVIAAPLNAGFQPLLRRNLEPRVKHFLQLPPFGFAGFHPDMIYIPHDGKSVAGPTGPYQSRLAIACYLAGISVEECVDLYNSLIFGRLGYFNEFSVQWALVQRGYASAGIDVSPMLEDWLRDGCFMHSINHPHIRVLFSLARAVCGRLGLPIENAAASAADLPDDLAHHPTHAVLPEIAQAIGIAPSGAFRGHIGLAQYGPYELEEFVARSYAAFSAVPDAVLGKANRLDEVLAAIGGKLRQAEPPPPPVACALLTWHGTVVRRTDAGNLVGQALDDFSTGEDLILPVPLSPRFAPLALPVLGGITVAPHTTPGLVQIARGDRVLCAEAPRPEVDFNRFEALDWESFLPVPPAGLAALRAVVNRAWREQESGVLHPAIMVRMLPGFILQIGGYRLALRGGIPVEVPEDGAGTILLHHEKRLVTLLPEAEPAPPPASGGEAAAGILPRGARVTIKGLPESVHPPYYGADTDREWVITLAAPYLPERGQRQYGVTIARDAALLQRLDVAAKPGAKPAAGPDRPLVLATNGLNEIGDLTLEAALRLHLLAPMRDANAALLLPADAKVDLPLLDVLGLGGPTEILPGSGWQAPDVLRLEDSAIATLPAVVLQDFRARAVFHAGTQAPQSNILLIGGGPAGIAQPGQMLHALRRFGFTAVNPASLHPRERAALFARARMVVGTAGAGLANLLFCPSGARIVEMTPLDRFHPGLWLAAEKLGLVYGVLPCAAEPDGLHPDAEKLAALLDVLSKVA